MENTMPNILVTGASGLLGRAIMKHLEEKNWRATGLAFSRCRGNLVKCDLMNPEEINRVIDDKKPDFIIHAAAERYPDRVKDHHEATKKMNIEATKCIALAAKRNGSKLIYISTDYVFDGNSPPSKTTDIGNPLNFYGQTKYDGEKEIQEHYPEGSSILRIPMLYGPVEYVKESAVTRILDDLLKKSPLSVSSCERRYPCHTSDIALILIDLVEAMQKDDSLNGIFQWSGLEMLTKYDMVNQIASALSLDSSHITPETSIVKGSGRPFDTQMDNSRLLNLNISHHLKFQDSIKVVLLPWLNQGGAK